MRESTTHVLCLGSVIVLVIWDIQKQKQIVYSKRKLVLPFLVPPRPLLDQGPNVQQLLVLMKFLMKISTFGDVCFLEKLFIFGAIKI